VQRHGQSVETTWTITALAPIYLDEPRLVSGDPGGNSYDEESARRRQESWPQILEHLDQVLSDAD
jgi:hypothetical protein